MAGADISLKSGGRKKRVIAIGFSIYIQIPSAPTFPRAATGYRTNSHFSPVTVTREEGTYFSRPDRVNLPLTSVTLIFITAKAEIPCDRETCIFYSLQLVAKSQWNRSWMNCESVSKLWSSQKFHKITIWKIFYYYFNLILFLF